MPPRELALVSDAPARVGPRRAAVPQPAPGPDAALVRRARAGDVDAFAAIYQTYRPAVLATCVKRLRDRDQADDAVQDTFLRAYASLSRFDEERPLGPWLNAIAVRRCIDLMRRSWRIAASEDVEEHLAEEPEPDPTLGAVIAIEERRRLERALRQLHPRYRRALLLHALEGWSHADIAAAEGISIAATKSLLFHARDNLRRACRRGVFGMILLPAGALRRRLRHLASEARSRLAATVEPALGAAAGSFAHAAAAIAITLAALGPQGGQALSSFDASSTTSDEASALQSGGGAAASGSHGEIAPRPRGDSLVGSILNPTKGATPESTVFTSVAPSPNYEEDHTLVAAGRVCLQAACTVLFTSHDGGATWKRRATENFRGYQILLPPSYPADPRIFAMGPTGLQVALDGSSFKVVAPFKGDVAMSPLFDGPEERLLIGATVVTEYWADMDLPKPATLVGPAGTWLTVAFSPSYADDHIVFVGGIRPDATGNMRPTVNRCASSVCESVVFTEGVEAPWLRPSPRFANDGTVYAFTSEVVFRSVDGAKTFASNTPPFAVEGSVRDLVVADDGTLFAAVQNSQVVANGVFRSSDGGATWRGGPVPFVGFEAGVARIVRLPDGHLIALATGTGIACSADGGRSWALRCTR